MPTMRELQLEALRDEEAARFNRRSQERYDQEVYELQADRQRKGYGWANEYGPPPESSSYPPSPVEPSDMDKVNPWLPQRPGEVRDERGAMINGEWQVEKAPPPTHTFTNIPDTAGRAVSEDRPVTFIAGNPDELKAARDAGVTDIRKGVEYKEPSVVPSKPDNAKLTEYEQAQKAFGHILSTAFPQGDPRDMDPVEAGEKASSDFISKYSNILENDKDPRYQQYKGELAKVEKRAQEAITFQQKRREDMWNEFQKFFVSEEGRADREKARTENLKAKREAEIQKVQTRVSALTKDWTNYDLTPQQRAEIDAAKPADRTVPTQAPLKKGVFDNINKMLIQAGAEPLTQEKIKTIRGYGFMPRSTWEDVTRYSYNPAGGGVVGEPSSDPRAAKALEILRSRGKVR